MAYVHEHTGVSSIVNDAAYAAIVGIVNECRETYKQENASWNEQFAEDDAYIAGVLEQFAKTRDFEELLQKVSEQDTYVRDYYAYVIEDLYSDYYNGEWE